MDKAVVYDNVAAQIQFIIVKCAGMEIKMYKIYNKIKLLGFFILGLAIVMIVMFLMSLPSITQHVSTTEDWVVLIGIILVSILFIIISRPFLTGYGEIRRLKKINPELVRTYEEEFDKSVRIGSDIWMSEHFYYFRAIGNLKVLRFYEIKELRIRSSLSKGNTSYHLEVHTVDQSFWVCIISGFRNKDKAIQCANMIAEKSGVPLNCEKL